MMSNAYAEALVMLGREQGELERMREDVEALSCALAENPDCTNTIPREVFKNRQVLESREILKRVPTIRFHRR